MRERRIQVQDKESPAALLMLFVLVKCSLDVSVCREEKNEFHRQRACRIRCLMSSQEVTREGSLRYSSILRSNSAMSSSDTGTLAGFAAKSSQSSDTRASFSAGERRWISGCFSRIIFIA